MSLSFCLIACLHVCLWPPVYHFMSGFTSLCLFVVYLTVVCLRFTMIGSVSFHVYLLIYLFVCLSLCLLMHICLSQTVCLFICIYSCLPLCLECVLMIINGLYWNVVCMHIWMQIINLIIIRYTYIYVCIKREREREFAFLVSSIYKYILHSIISGETRFPRPLTPYHPPSLDLNAPFLPSSLPTIHYSLN